MLISSRERVLRTIRRQPVDCLPAAPYMYDLAAVFADVPLRDFYTRSDSMVRAQLALHEYVGQDVIAIGADNYYIAEGFGCRTTRDDDELPGLLEPPLSRLQDVYDLPIPDPHVDGRMPVMIEAIRETRRAVGSEVAIRCPGTGPFALASYLIGTQAWLMEIGMAQAKMPEANESALHHALHLATEALIRFGCACWDAGADIIHCGDSLASCDVISPTTYRGFAWPYQKRVFQAWKDYGITGSLLHICGNSTHVLDLYATSGADLVEIDNKVDLEQACQVVGGRVVLMGNVHTVNDLLDGTPETVRVAAQRCIRQAAGYPFILGSGCLVPRRTPVENVRQLVRTAHEHRFDAADS